MPSNKIKIKIVDVAVQFDSIRALNNVSFHVNTGEFVGILGPNGAGKTTLLRCIYKAVKPSSGAIYIDGKNVEEFSYKKLARIISSVPAEIPIEFNLTVADIILTGRYPYMDGSVRWWESKKDLLKADEVIRKLRLQNLLNRLFYTLSSGQKRIVLIAKALVQEPKIILADELISNLDLKYQLEVSELLKEISRSNVTVLATFHDLNIASRFCNKLILLKDGKVISIGEPSKILTPDLIREVYDVKAKVIKEGDKLIIIPEKSINSNINYS